MKAGILPPELKTVSDLLNSDAHYAVPKYQRSFAWGSDEIEEFWDDLCDATNREAEYFLGTMVFQKKAASGIEIIDGQQRLTCVTMVLSAIRSVFLAEEDHERASQLFSQFLGAKGFRRDSHATPKLQLNDINNDTYVEFVIESTTLAMVDEKLAREKKSLHESNSALLKAYRFFLEKVTSEAGKLGAKADDEFIVPLLDCLRSDVKLIAIPVTSEEDANLFFESLNARGRELAVSDLVKNRLYAEARDDVSKVQRLWQKMEGELGRRPITEFVRHYWIAKKASGLVREKDLYKLFLKEVRNKKSAALKLADDLSRSATDYAKITDPDLWEAEPAYDADFFATQGHLKLFRVSQCNPILLNGIQCFKRPNEVAALFRIVANFSFRYFIIGNQSPGNLERESNRIAEGIRIKKHKRASDVAQALAAISPDATFRADFELAEFSKSQAKLARYTLIKLANHLGKASRKGGEEYMVNSDSKAVNLEHVLPQNFDAKWRSAFPTNVEPTEYVYRLGNMTLLTTKLNNNIANGDFDKKKKAALDVSELALNKVFRSLTRWTDKEIEERQTRFAASAVDIWSLR